MGIGGCHWFEGFGNYTEDHRVATFGANSPTITPDSPVALLLKVFYSGIADITLSRWVLCVFESATRVFLARMASLHRAKCYPTPFGRIAFANTDLASIMEHRCSILEAQRAVGQLLDR